MQLVAEGLDVVICSYFPWRLAQYIIFPSSDIDSGYYTVKFDSLLLKEAVVEGDGIIPPLRSDESSSEESEEDNVDDSGYAKGDSSYAKIRERESARKAHNQDLPCNSRSLELLPCLSRTLTG